MVRSRVKMRACASVTNIHNAPSVNLMPGGAFGRNESYTYFATRAQGTKSRLLGRRNLHPAYLQIRRRGTALLQPNQIGARGNICDSDLVSALRSIAGPKGGASDPAEMNFSNGA